MTEAPVPIDDVTRRRALVGLQLAYLAQFASMGLQLPFVALAMERAGAGPAVIGAMWAGRSLSGAVVPVLWGLLADRLGGARPLVVVSLLGGGTIFFVLAEHHEPSTAIALFVLYGFIATPASSLMDGMVLTAIAPNTQRYGRYRVVGTVGFGLGTAVTAVLLDRGLVDGTPQALFPICGGLSLTAAVVMATVVPHLPRRALTDLRAVGTALRAPGMLVLIGGAGLLWASHAAYTGFLAPLADRAGLPTMAVGAAMVAAVVVEAVLMPASTRILVRVSAGTLMVGCAAVAIARWLLTAEIHDATTFIVVNAMHGVTFGLFFVVVVGVVASRVPAELRQTAQGLLASLSLGVGGLVGGLLVGQVLESGSPPASVWRAMAIIAALSCALLMVAARQGRR